MLTEQFIFLFYWWYTFGFVSIKTACAMPRLQNSQNLRGLNQQDDFSFMLHVHCTLAGDSSLELSSSLQDTVWQCTSCLECYPMQRWWGMQTKLAKHTLVFKASTWKGHKSLLIKFHWPRLSHNLAWFQRAREVTSSWNEVNWLLDKSSTVSQRPYLISENTWFIQPYIIWTHSLSL